MRRFDLHPVGVGCECEGRLSQDVLVEQVLIEGDEATMRIRTDIADVEVRAEAVVGRVLNRQGDLATGRSGQLLDPPQESGQRLAHPVPWGRRLAMVCAITPVGGSDAGSVPD